MRFDLPTEWSIDHTPAPLEAEWRALEADGFGTPFQSYDWMRLFHEIAGEDALFVAGRSGARLVAVFPLRLKSGVLTWFGEALNNYNMPLISAGLRNQLSPGVVESIWGGVRTALGGPAASLLRRQPVYVNGQANPFAQWSAVTEPTSAYALTLGRYWPDFYETLHSAATRKTLRKKERALARSAPLEIGRPAGTAAYDAAKLLLRLKADQVNRRGGRNNLADARHQEILARFAAEHPDRARVYVMSREGAPLALAYRIENGADPILYQMAYVPGPDARYSPGRILLNRVLEEAVEEGRRVLDFAVGDEPYKFDLCDVVAPLTTSLAAHAPWGQLPVWAERGKLALKRIVKARRGQLGGY